ncbi:MAG: electron transport protein SCO1/SenC [Caulobacteraceae bacterium]|jgi:protein SCO1/2|nr:electron transport protein SCO1/SenC [Caulobacteraceae bacterium]
MKRRAWIGAIVAVAAVVVALLLVWRSAGGGHEAAPSAVGGPFHLVDQSGASVDERILRGKWSAVFFGYTYCPDVCPTTLAALGQAVGDLGANAGRFQVVFITVDPERDTPGALQAYLASPTFPKGVRGLTGSAEQIAAVGRAYHVYYQKVPQGSSYSMDHSAVVYLMDPQGQFIRPLDVGVAPPQIARQIRAAMDGA